MALTAKCTFRKSPPLVWNFPCLNAYVTCMYDVCLDNNNVIVVFYNNLLLVCHLTGFYWFLPNLYSMHFFTESIFDDKNNFGRIDTLTRTMISLKFPFQDISVS